MIGAAILGAALLTLRSLVALARRFEASTECNRLIDFERALNALEGSQAVGRLASVDSRVSLFRKQVDEAADDLTRAQTGLAAAKSLEKNVRRSASEIVDERLALISPLLNELYQRLRPHSDWRSIEYSIRGDVRRFLSLKVGNDLNPQAAFSSGQRRAAGLAFLLSVHLARSWARWTTLVLDDPVQHIDDFRPQHLVEVLSALRQSGRQVICAVEDGHAGLLTLWVARRNGPANVNRGASASVACSTQKQSFAAKACHLNLAIRFCG